MSSRARPAARGGRSALVGLAIATASMVVPWWNLVGPGGEALRNTIGVLLIVSIGINVAVRRSTSPDDTTASRGLIGWSLISVGLGLGVHTMDSGIIGDDTRTLIVGAAAVAAAALCGAGLVSLPTEPEARHPRARRIVEAIVVTSALCVVAQLAMTARTAPTAPTLLRVALVVLIVAGIVRQLLLHRDNQQLTASLRTSTEALRHQARHDPLTGVLNRQFAFDEISILLDADPTRGVALLLVDIDRFTEVNDSLGHDRGDTLLVEIATRLRGLVGSDQLLARIGGDQFMLARPCSDVDHALLIASRIQHCVSFPLALGGVEIVPTVSIGIAMTALFDDGQSTAQELMNDADLALGRAKRGGRNQIEMFDGALRDHARRQLMQAAELRRALARDEIEAFYQPLVDASSGRICAAEALIRWNHPTQGVLAPDQWMPVAEETGLLVDIGRATLVESCRRFAALNAGRPDQPLCVAVNLSATELRADGLVDSVRVALSASGLPAPLLMLEVSEHVLSDELTTAVLRELHDLGVRLSIDDFGTGYSSFGQLRRFPIDEIKIDQTFVRGLGVDSADTTIVEMVCGLGRGLGLEVVAEGVTTEAQAEQLRALGCHKLQGWLYGKALPFSRFTVLLARMNSVEAAAAAGTADEAGGSFDDLGRPEAGHADLDLEPERIGLVEPPLPDR